MESIFVSDLVMFLSLVLCQFDCRRLSLSNTELIERIEQMEDRMEYLEESL